MNTVSAVEALHPFALSVPVGVLTDVGTHARAFVLIG